MVEAGQLSDGMLELSPSLAFRFSVYGSVVAHRRSQKLLVVFPFSICAAMVSGMSLIRTGNSPVNVAVRATP
jgi:hypothetical protein